MGVSASRRVRADMIVEVKTWLANVNAGATDVFAAAGVQQAPREFRAR